LHQCTRMETWGRAEPGRIRVRETRRAISNVLVALLLVLLAISAAGVGIVYMNKQAQTIRRIVRVDASESHLYVSPVTGNGTLTLVFINTGTTTVTLQWVKIDVKGLVCVYFTTEAKLTYGSNTVTGTVIASDPKSSGNTEQGLVLAAQTSATVRFTQLREFSAVIPPNTEHMVTIYTTAGETFTFKLVAETSGG